MDTAHGNLDKKKEKNPFSVPPGYFEGLTDHIMNQLPDKKEEAPPITFIEKIRPWLYMAAMFVGIGLFLKLLIGIPDPKSTGNATDSLLVQTGITDTSMSAIQPNEEDEEYLEYVEEQYSGYLLEGEEEFSE